MKLAKSLPHYITSPKGIYHLLPTRKPYWNNRHLTRKLGSSRPRLTVHLYSFLNFKIRWYLSIFVERPKIFYIKSCQGLKLQNYIRSLKYSIYHEKRSTLLNFHWIRTTSSVRKESHKAVAHSSRPSSQGCFQHISMSQYYRYSA